MFQIYNYMDPHYNYMQPTGKKKIFFYFYLSYDKETNDDKEVLDDVI